MVTSNHIFVGILILQIYAHAAPSDVGKLEAMAKVDKVNDTQHTLSDVEDSSSTTHNGPETTREKRYYNPFGYGFPPINPVIYPSFNKRDDFPNTGIYGVDDPLSQIHRRVQEIASVVRQPPQIPPPIPHVPIFYPVLFVPPFDCACNPSYPEPTGPPTNEGNGTPPNVTNRFPEMEDDRQNWGFVTNEIGGNDGNGQPIGIDFSRPISFDPIRLNRPNARPPPPVDRGTTQGGAADNNPAPEGDVQPQPQSPPSTTRPPPPPTRPPPPPPAPGAQRPPFNVQRPTAARPPPQNSYPVGPGPPSPCDGAILTCCHRPQVIYDCFVSQGCPNPPSFGNPCEPNNILRVIERFQNFYGTRSG